MLILQDFRYRCAQCGDPMMRDGGNRLEPGQAWETLMCINGTAHFGPNGKMCPNFGVRVKKPLVYVAADLIPYVEPARDR
jgi:hypothetical protein